MTPTAGERIARAAALLVMGPVLCLVFVVVMTGMALACPLLAVAALCGWWPETKRPASTVSPEVTDALRPNDFRR